jgi:hypothetical protein
MASRDRLLLPVAGGFVNAAFSGNADLPAPVADLAKDAVTPTSISNFRRHVTTRKIGAILVDAGSAPKWSWELRMARLHALARGATHRWCHHLRQPACDPNPQLGPAEVRGVVRSRSETRIARCPLS